jgi:hypothetical protein
MLIGLLVAFVGGGSTAWHLASWKHDAEDKAHVVAALEAQKRAEDRATEISDKFMTKLDNLKIVNTTINQKVQHELETRVYSDCKLPDSGVLLLNSGIDAANDALGVARTMPATPAPHIEGRPVPSNDGRSAAARSRYDAAIHELRAEAAGSTGKREASGKIRSAP